MSQVATAVFLFLVLVVPTFAPIVSAAPQMVSGTDMIPVNLTNGNSVYSISYSYPTTADVGSNFSVTVGFGVVSFTGDKLYVSSYSLSAILSFPSGKTVTNMVSVSNSSAYIYAGGSAPSTDIVLTLTKEDSGLAPGQSTPINVTVGFADEVWYEPPVGNYYPEYGSAVVGQAIIVNSSSPQIWQPMVLIGSGVLILFAGLVARRSARRGAEAASDRPPKAH